MPHNTGNGRRANPRIVKLKLRAISVGAPVIGAPALSTPSKVIVLAELAHEIINITELEPEPNNGAFIGKHINRDGSITQYPTVTWWKQSVAQVPATIPHLFAYLREARKRNICLIRGAPANVERRPTRRWKAGVVVGGKDRRNHGFVDEPTKLLFLDGDDIKIKWRDNPEGAIKSIVAQLGEPWAATSFVWFFSATHGLEFDEHKRWTGRISDGKVRVRLVFITERPLNETEASALTSIAKVRIPRLDASISRQVQPNYIKRPHWAEHPDRDVLGDIPTIGWVRGANEYLAVPDDLTHQARWAKAQGHHVDIADHPDAEAAVRGIGGGGEVRAHVKAAVVHLLRANPVPEVVSFADHSSNITAKLQNMIAQHREEIADNLVRNGRSKHIVDELLQHTNPAFAHWCLDHQAVLRAKTIKLSKEEPAKADDQATRDAIFARVAHTIERARKGETINGDPLDPLAIFIKKYLERPPVVLLVAPAGSRKSTVVRTNAVQYVTEHSEKSVVILMPRHKLGDEQIEMLQRDHNVTAAVWRGRHADDPDTPGKKMCWRDEEAKEVEAALLKVDEHLCKQGRGKDRIECPFFLQCGYQAQKQIVAQIWFAAHECMVHEMPKAFGDVGWVIIDESPLDAFMFGIDINDKVTLELDALRVPLPADPAKFDGYDGVLMLAREELYGVLNKLQVPIEFHWGAPVPRKSLNAFVWTENVGADYDAEHMRNLTFRGKVKPDIRPDMTKKQVMTELQKAAGNSIIKKETALWELIGATEEVAEDKLYGRIQVHRGGEGRIIRMVGLKRLAKGWSVQTLILDATGDAELLRAIWPDLETDESVQGWQQLPRPNSVRIFQCVDHSIPKSLVAVEAKNPEEMERKIDAARRLYAALLMKALEYGGQDVAAVVYKSTEEWILKNCFVPEWLKLYHHGDTTGTNKLQKVRALFVIGRPLASPEDVTRQTEALFGEYIPQRWYVERRKRGRIPIVPDAEGNNMVRVDVREHEHPLGQRVKRQITEAAIIQAAGRARAGLRGEKEPLDLHLWTDVPVPELGLVEPVLWNELEADLDGLMLATGGVWLECIPHAAQAYKGLFTADGLKSGRKARSGCFANRESLLVKHPHLTSITYQRAGKGQRPQQAAALMDPPAARAWLEEKLGPLAWCEEEEVAIRHSRSKKSSA